MEEEEGGGFFRSGSTTATPSKPGAAGGGGGSGVRRENPITPLTCKQISKAEQLPSGMINIDGREMHMVTIVGQVVEKVDQSSVILLRVDDGTGVVDVRKWVDAADDAMDGGGGGNGGSSDQGDAAISVGMYVRVYGDLRTYQGNLIVISTRILLIQDYNEITYNLLLSITAHLNNTRGPIPQLTVAADGTAAIGTAAAAVAMGGGAAAAVANGGLSMYNSRTAMGGGGGGSGGLGGSSDTFPTRTHENIYNIIKSSGVESGLSAADLFDRLNGSVTIEEINDCIRYLVDEGHIYTANDEEHYLAE